MKTAVHNILNAYFKHLGITEGFNIKDPAHMVLFRRSAKDVGQLLKMASDDEEVALRKMSEVVMWAKAKGLDWSLSTVIKRWFSDNKLAQKLVYTDENWKKELEKERDVNVIHAGLGSIRDILVKKGIRNE